MFETHNRSESRVVGHSAALGGRHSAVGSPFVHFSERRHKEDGPVEGERRGGTDVGGRSEIPPHSILEQTLLDKVDEWEDGQVGGSADMAELKDSLAQCKKSAWGDMAGDDLSDPRMGI